MIYGLALCLYVLCYVFVQVMFLFYGCHVSQHKRKVLVFLVGYTILFKGMDFLLNSPDPSAVSTTTYWTYWAVHTLDTFILITLMAVYADGTLGRNWVKLFFYYDLVTIGANALVQNKLVLFLTDHHLVESATLFSATQPRDLLSGSSSGPTVPQSWPWSWYWSTSLWTGSSAGSRKASVCFSWGSPS